MTKKELLQLYNFSYTTLQRLLNDRYFEQLNAEGYEKNQRVLSPRVINKFYELYGKPLSQLPE